MLKWCRNSHDFDVNRKRNFIVNSLTHVIQVAVENKLPKVDIFNENFEFVEPESKHKDIYYGFVAEELFERIIPEANRLIMDKDPNGVFSWTVEEAVDAIEHFKDPYGPVGHTNVKVLFKRCSCKGKNGKRRVCVPPCPGYQCERIGCVVKKKITSYKESIEIERENRHQMQLKEEMAEAARKAEEYCASVEGKEYWRELAMEKASASLEKDRFDAHVKKLLEKLNKKKEGDDMRRNRKRAAMHKQKEKTIDRLQKKRQTLVNRKERLFGWELEKCEEEIADCDDDLDHLVEDEELMMLDEDEKEKLEIYEEEKAEIEAGKDYQPAGKWQRDFELSWSKEHRERTERIERDMIDQFIKKRVAEAKVRVEREHEVMMKIMLRWQRLGLYTMFDHWATLVDDKKEYLEHMRLQEIEAKQLREEEAIALHELKVAELNKWVEKFDEWTDLPYWEHSETGQTTYDQPTLETVNFQARIPGSNAATAKLKENPYKKKKGEEKTAEGGAAETKTRSPGAAARAKAKAKGKKKKTPSPRRQSVTVEGGVQMPVLDLTKARGK